MHTKLKRHRPSYLLHGASDPSSFVRTVLRLFARCRAFARSFGLSCGVAFERGVGKEMERMLGGGAVRAATSLPMHTASSGTVRAGCHRAWQGAGFQPPGPRGSLVLLLFLFGGLNDGTSLARPGSFGQSMFLFWRGSLGDIFRRGRRRGGVGRCLIYSPPPCRVEEHESFP